MRDPMRTDRFRTLRLPVAIAWLALAGGCHKPQPHWVTLTWDAPKPSAGVEVASYNIYRSTTSGGPFARLASKVPGPPYDDHLVNSGRTYYYVVTAVDNSGRESGYSAEIQAKIPH